MRSFIGDGIDLSVVLEAVVIARSANRRSGRRIKGSMSSVNAGLRKRPRSKLRRVTQRLRQIRIRFTQVEELMSQTREGISCKVECFLYVLLSKRTRPDYPDN